MSFGFGFSLPAILRKVAGYDPFNQSGPTLDLVFAGVATDLDSLGGYTLTTDFIVPQYQIAAQYTVWENGMGLVSKSFSDIITFSRNSNATYFDSAGVLKYAPNNAIRNNTMVGAVAGTPGTLPTNWIETAIATGLTRQIIGTGTSNGITYIDVKISGTTSSTAGWAWQFESATQIAALSGQAWTGSVYFAIVGGSTANLTDLFNRVTERSAAGGYLTESNQDLKGATATMQRFSLTRTANQATTAFVQSGVYFTAPSGVAIDITLRIGLPQLEIGNTAGPAIPTSGTAYYGPRFDYNPSTLAARGLLIEEQRTNSIRNNTMQGAVAGTPGTLPTNWQSLLVTGLTSSIIGTGTLDGITYLDVRINGTPTVSSYYNLVPDILVAAVSGQTWVGSFWAAIVGGSLANTNANIEIRESDAAQGFLTNTLTVLPITSTLTRYSQARLLNNASTAFVSVRYVWQVTVGQPVDFTLRIGLPQLERGAFATSVIPTTTTALTRAADVARVNTLSPWYNAAEGTLYAEISAANGFNVANNFGLGRFAAIQDVAVDNTTEMFFDGNANQAPRYRVRSGGTNQAIGNSATAYTANTVLKGALAYAVNDFAGYSRGVQDLTDSSGVLPVSQTFLSLGSEGGTQNFLNGWLRRVSYYPRRLSNAELVAITS